MNTKRSRPERKRLMQVDTKRCMATTYRIQSGGGGELFEIVEYPRTPASIATGFYRFDLLPEWVKDCIRTLDVAGAGIMVEGLGHKVGKTTYWIEPTLDDMMSELTSRK